MNKKAYIRTLEAVVAIILVFTFITMVIKDTSPSGAQVPKDIALIQSTVIKEIENKEEYRESILADENLDITIKPFIDSVISGTMDYKATTCDISSSVNCDFLIDTLPEKPVYAKSIIISHTLESEETRLFTFYIWRIG